jgi:hypothetical protein
MEIGVIQFQGIRVPYHRPLGPFACKHIAQRRMFSKNVARTDLFLDMSQTVQNLYFHLGIDADDDGFVSPKMIMRMLGSTTDDLRILIAKGFVIAFEDGVIVIRHWRVNYKEMLYKDHKEKLGLNNGIYDLVLPMVPPTGDNLDTQVSTTVVIMQLITQPRLPDVCSGHTWRGFGASAAKGTSRGSGSESAAAPAPNATTAAEARERSRGSEAAAGLEHRQAAGPLGGRWGFFKASTAMIPARSTDSRAKAHMASVICRYQPVQLRTS